MGSVYLFLEGTSGVVAYPVPRVRVRVLVSDGIDDPVENAIRELVALGVGTSGKIADLLRITEPMVRSALDLLAREGDVEFDEATMTWRHHAWTISMSLQSWHDGFLFWDPVNNDFLKLVWPGDTPWFKPNLAEFFMSPLPHDRFDADPIFADAETVRVRIALLNQNLEQMELGHSKSLECALVALHLNEHENVIRSGVTHVLRRIEFLSAAGGSWEWVFSKAQFHGEALSKDFDIAPRSDELRFSELFQKVDDHLKSHGAELENKDRHGPMPSGTLEQHRESVARMRAKGDELGLTPARFDAAGLSEKMLFSLYQKSVKAAEFGTTAWDDWGRAVGSLVESWITRCIESTDAGSVVQQLREGKLETSDSASLLAKFGVFGSQAEKELGKALPVASQSKTKNSKPGLRAKVVSFMVAAMCDSPKGKACRAMLEELIDKHPSVFEKQSLDLIVNIRNLVSHTGAESTDSDSKKDRKRVFETLKKTFDGDLPRATELITLDLMSVLSANLDSLARGSDVWGPDVGA